VIVGEIGLQELATLASPKIVDSGLSALAGAAVTQTRAALRHQTFFTFADLNAAIWARLNAITDHARA
jgi:hypothetical protein